jgi:hypothetical protein
MGRGGALGALDQGWEAAAAAVDGEQKLRRRSGEVESSGRGKAVQMWVGKCEREGTGSSRTHFKSRRGHNEQELVLAADGVRGGRGRSSGRGRAAWRVRKKTTGRTRTATGREATHGGCQEQEVAPVVLQRR